jgi:orotate phosphoribosyltransferase
MNTDIIEIFKSVGGIFTDDHFIYTSGKHGSGYLNKDALYPHVELTSQVCKIIAEKHKDLEIDVVLGPAIAGTILSTWTAYHLGQLTSKEVFGVYTEKNKEGKQIVTRGYDEYLNKGQRILIVEDLTTTGNSAKRLVDLVKDLGGDVVAVCVMINRNPKEVNSEFFGVPFSSLGVFEMESYDFDKLPDEIKNRPINRKIGHGKYLKD